MKKSLVLITAAALVAIGCERGEIREGSGARDRINQQEEAQQEQLDAQQQQIEEEAKAQKETIDAQADAEKAQLEAQKKQIEAEAEAQRAQAKAQEQAQEAQADALEAQADAQRETAEAGQEVREAAGTARANDQLKQDVQQAIFGDVQPGTANQNVQITVQDGNVTLTGTVRSDEEKDRYEEAAKNVPGVKDVDNKLKVQD